MQSRNNRSQVKPIRSSNSFGKRLGSYLVESGLLTTAQLDVALKDQKMTEEMTGTHMQLGEIVTARGWVKEQTIEYLMRKIVLPERQLIEKRSQEITVRPSEDTVQQVRAAQGGKPVGQVIRKNVPISKPLPSIPTEDGEVWVG